MIKSLFGSMDISASGLSTQRTKINLISENIANAETTRTAEGGPYRRKLAVQESGVKGAHFSEILKEHELKMEKTDQKHFPDEPFKLKNVTDKTGVHIEEIINDQSQFKMVFDPSHPDANEKGYVAMPNVNVVQEMTDLITTSRNFEANITAMNTSKKMIRSTFRI
ncbi:MAG: flagellar basal body rod protein FlgC [Candidatus Cloacimonadota bacterium]|nr:flagellar basal body rod protein FlgC [Candidatus Cloacimonadota bacterium]